MGKKDVKDAPNEVKVSIFGVRMTNKEKAELYNYALHQNTTMSEIVRFAIEDYTGIKLSE